MGEVPLTVDDLERYLRARHISAEVLRLPVLTPTVGQAAQAVGSPPEDIVKSLLFVVDGRPVLAIVCGEGHVQTRALANRFGVGRKRVKLAGPEVVLTITGYPVGGLPPFGHRKPLTTMIDRRVLARAQIYAGGGSDSALMRLNPQELLRVTGGVIADLCELPPEGKERDRDSAAGSEE